MQAQFIPLAQAASATLARARDLCCSAHRVVDEAGAVYQSALDCSAAARHVSSDCRHMRELWTDVRTHSGRLVARCAYCERIRAQDGTWFEASPVLARVLGRLDVVVVSHGICPDCMARNFPRELLPGRTPEL